MNVVGSLASNVARKNRSSPGLASSLPQIHCGCGAAAGLGGAVIASHQLASADFVAAVAGVAGFVAGAAGFAGLAPPTMPQHSRNMTSTQKSFLGIRT